MLDCLLDVPRNSVKGAWLDNRHPDAKWGDLLGERLGKALQGELGHVVEAYSRIGNHPADRADIDDVAALALAHARKRRLRHVPRPKDIGFEHCVDARALAFLNRSPK